MDGVATPIIGRPRPLPGHDTPNPAYHPHTLNYEEPNKSQSIGTLATGSTFLVGSIMMIDDKGRFPQFIQLTLIAIALIIIITGIVYYFSPLPVPRWADARYQYMKRHGMLDKNGDPLPQFEVPADTEEPTTNDQTGDTL